MICTIMTSCANLETEKNKEQGRKKNSTWTNKRNR